MLLNSSLSYRSSEFFKFEHTMYQHTVQTSSRQTSIIYQNAANFMAVLQKKHLQSAKCSQRDEESIQKLSEDFIKIMVKRTKLQ